MAKKEKEVIELILPEYVLRGFNVSGIPYEVQLRNYLNEQGFKFKDDGELSALSNTKPEPLGKMEVVKEGKNTKFTQTI